MKEIGIGLLFSTSGAYGAIGRNALAGAELAIRDLKTAGTISFTPRHADPKGQPELYQRMTADVLADGSIRNIVGGITSWSRKDMISVMEKHGALLWYPCPYEGFESNDHVVYLGACPNQHLIPLLDRMIASDHRRVFLAGSNYVWGWETLRVARERLGAAGFGISGERYIPLGDEDCTRLLAEVRDAKCDLVLNALVGPSNYAFMQGLADWQDDERPQVISANQTEADLDDFGPGAEGMLSIGPWFETTAAGKKLKARAAAEYGDEFRVSCFFATAYTAVHVLANSILACGSDDPRRVFAAATARPHDTVLGSLSIDPATRHCALPAHFAVARQGRFEIIETAGEALWPDPYLAHLPAAPRSSRAGERAKLTVVK